VGIASAISAMFYFLVQTWLFLVIAIVLIGAALALSFIKINGRPLIKLGISAANFYWKPQLYVWQPEHTTVQHKPTPMTVREMAPIEAIAAGGSLHKSWQNLQTGTPVQKTSDRQFIEKRMNERYQIFQRQSGDRQAARRVDYR
jgi:hypothetical protein